MVVGPHNSLFDVGTMLFFVQIVSSDDTKAYLNKFGGDPNIQSPAEAQKRFVQDIKDWGDYVRMAKIPPL